jgi:ABC-type Fe3+ transport system substrate-binding protein
LFLAGCDQGVPPKGTPVGPLKTLTVVTPHSEKIREAFTAGFSSWYLLERNTPVHIQWVYLGTPQCVEYIRQVPEMRAQGDLREVPDVMFGGGIADHARLADEKLSRSVDLGDAMAHVPAEVHGLATRDEAGRWLATGLSSFGILYNEAACRERGIDPPTTWADLADPRFFSWLAVADPTASGSHRECMVLILQHEGLPRGWSTILRILGNTRALSARSGDALRRVFSGTALATFAVNFDGMALVAESGGALRYIDPPGATAATPDIISVLSTAREPELAKDFVRYVLSEEGQALWGVHREHRQSPGATLFHYPIAENIYEKYADHLAVDHNPLKEDFGLPVDEAGSAQRARMVKPLVQAACHGANHVALQQVWRAVLDAGDAAALAELTALPFDEAALAEQSETLANRDSQAARQVFDAWVATFGQTYARVREMLGQ